MSSSSRRPEVSQQALFWKRQIAEGPDPFSLPTDETRLPAPSFLRESLSLIVPADAWARALALAARCGTDPFTVVLAALALVAARLTRQSDLWLGTVALVHGDDGSAAPNLLPLRLRAPADGSVREFLAAVHETVTTAAQHRDVPFARVAALAGAQPLFRVLAVPVGVRAAAWEAPVAPDPRALGADAAACDLILRVVASGEAVELSASYDAELFRPDTIRRLLEQVRLVLAAMAAGADVPLRSVALVSESERQLLVRDWNRTDTPFERNACVHHLIEQQVERTPNAIALTYGAEELTYAALNAAANRLAHLLLTKGVGRDVPVGVCVERSPALVIAVLAIHKAGGAYIPMDPGYPAKRIAYMIEDSGVRLVLADSDASAALATPAEVVRLDGSPDAGQPATNPARAVPSQSLAYIIYTSGSTGNPKGVMVEHRHVVNFFAGMDQQLGTRAGTWLAVTSLSFDISVLELFWTLSRGFNVVLFSPRAAAGATIAPAKPGDAVDFSLLYFASDEGDYAESDGREKYRLLIEGARFADEHGFSAVWTPERHFHTFGGMFPSPAIAASALAMITKRVSLRAGSVVLPLHNPIRVTEEWSLVDNLSNGRVAVSIAAGWQPQDFAIDPAAFADRYKRMFDGIATIRALWSGETRELPGGDGKPVTVITRPRPVQKELPIWVTASGSPDTFRQAGEVGANLLTHLLLQSIDQLRERIAIYRKAWQEHGHPGESGTVTLMLHTFVSDNEAHVRSVVHEPFKNYLKGSVGLFAAVAPKGVDVSKLSPADLEALAEHAFERYFVSSGLFGTPESCAPMVARLRKLGVTELACLIDFGIPADTVLANLPFLNELRQRCANVGAAEEQSIDALLRRHRVTHFQCTPSMAAMLVRDPATAPALGGLDRMLVGGEALSEPLAAELQRALPAGKLTNMYGPTETTIWSMTHDVSAEPGPVPIGRPIANTQVYVLDAALNPLPAGVAGDLYIGGEGVARGYLKRAELTAERFVEDPFRPGNRLYRTGDLARHRPDGTLDFLGRSDHQVKFRGYRIELEEIERCLHDHPDVGQAAVVVHGSGEARLRLVAYVTAARAGGRPDPDGVRQHLRSQLPEFMVPDDFLILDQLPLTPNGKVDRKALPAPAPETSNGSAFEAPASATEQGLADLWQEALHVDHVGATDNFFDSGGHSLLAMQLARRIQERFGVEIELQDMFQRPVVRDLAAHIDHLKSTLAAQEEARRGKHATGFEYGDVD